MPRRRRLWAATALAALALSFAGAGQASAADVDNTKNAGFESGLSDWTCSAGSGTTVSSPVHGGTSALNGKDIPTVVDMQHCNSGSMLGCDGRVYSQGPVDFLTALACIQLEGGLAPSQVGIGVPASTRGAGGGHVAPSVVNAALDCLAKGTNCGAFKPSRTYPGLRGAMTWSTNWDATAGNAWSDAVAPTCTRCRDTIHPLTAGARSPRVGAGPRPRQPASLP
jgi:hypothetical protein